MYVSAQQTINTCIDILNYHILFRS